MQYHEYQWKWRNLVFLSGQIQFIPSVLFFFNASKLSSQKMIYWRVSKSRQNDNHGKPEKTNLLSIQLSLLISVWPLIPKGGECLWSIIHLGQKFSFLLWFWIDWDMLKLWKWYQNCLAVHPVKTQVISSGLIWGFGDIAAQAVTPSSADGHNQIEVYSTLVAHVKIYITC